MNNGANARSNSVESLDFERILSALKRRRKLFWSCFAVTAILSALITVLIPASYQSRSTILIEQQEIPQDLVRSTVTTFADQRIEVISQRVMTTANLWSIIEKFDLYKDELERDTRESVIIEMRDKAINRNVISADVVDPRSGRPTIATIAFQLSFTYENARLAQKVTNELTSLFLSENLKSRSEKAEQANAFLITESEKLGEEVRGLESKLAEFKGNHFDSLPELSNLNLSLLDRTEQALLDNQRQVSSVRERISFLRTQLAQIDPDAPVSSANGKYVLSNTARLRATYNELVQAEARYSGDHPQVKRLRDQLSKLLDLVPDEDAPEIKLRAYERELAQLQQRYSDKHPSVIALKERLARLDKLAEKSNTDTSKSKHSDADNPAYIQVKGQLETALIELNGLQERTVSLEAERAKYEARITESPRIEQEYQQLQRDYQSSSLKYAEVKAKQREAELGSSLETEQKGERFTLIEPPLVPEEAHSPNRKLLAVLGFILTIAVSFGSVVAFEFFDRSIRGRRTLHDLVGAAPLAVIPHIYTSAETAQIKRGRIMLIALLCTGLFVSLLIFHIFVKPLDVTWYIALRKFGWM